MRCRSRGRHHLARRRRRLLTSISARRLRLRRSRLASFTATAVSQGRKLAGSRTEPIFVQAMTHAAYAASSATASSRVT